MKIQPEALQAFLDAFLVRGVSGPTGGYGVESLARSPWIAAAIGKGEVWLVGADCESDHDVRHFPFDAAEADSAEPLRAEWLRLTIKGKPSIGFSLLAETEHPRRATWEKQVADCLGKPGLLAALRGWCQERAAAT